MLFVNSANTAVSLGNMTAGRSSMCYLRKTSHFKLAFKRSGVCMEAYCDADWAGDLTDSRSFSGYCVIFVGGVVHWRSRKQRCVATSSKHAEYIALFECMTGLKWFQSLFKELKQENYLRKAVTL